MSRPSAPRGAGTAKGAKSDKIEVHPDYLEMLRRARDRLELNDAKLAEATGLDDSMVSRFMTGAKTTVRPARAICAFLGVPYPVHSVRSLDEAAWIAHGRALAELAPDLFAEVLADLAQTVKSEETRRALHAKLRQRWTRGEEP